MSMTPVSMRWALGDANRTETRSGPVAGPGPVHCHRFRSCPETGVWSTAQRDGPLPCAHGLIEPGARPPAKLADPSHHEREGDATISRHRPCIPGGRHGNIGLRGN